MIIKGHEAIRMAQSGGVTLRKYADPGEGALDRVEIGDAVEIAKEDQNLIYCSVILMNGAWIEADPQS